MFNNAGFAITGEIAEMTIEQWERLIEVNLKGVVNGVMAAYPTMITQGNGHIINTASLAGISPTPVFGAYSTTKFAIVGLSRTLRIEAKKYGVKVTVLCPGFIKTAIYDNSVYINSQKDYLMKIIPVPVMDTEKAVRAMLKGIEKNKAMVVIPLYGKIQWWLDRLCQPLSAILGQKLIGDFRKKAKKL
jgi:short-subunit dehydrogenase